MDQDLLITKQTKKKKSDEEIPLYKNNIDLSEESKKRIVEEICEELDAIDAEYNDAGLLKQWDALDKQYEGRMREIPNMQFNISRKTTEIKCNAIERTIKEAIFGGERVFTASPRPEHREKHSTNITDKIEDFLDYKIDEVIPLEEKMQQVAHNATLKHGGVLKVVQKRKTRKRKCEEHYEGEEGIKSLLESYPDAAEKYPQYIKALSEGKSLDLIVEFDEVTYDDPFPKSVNPKNFRVRLNVEGLEGLKDSYLVAERKEYTYWELKNEEREENLFDVDELTYEADSNGEQKRIENFASEKYELWECVLFTRLDDKSEKGDIEEYQKCVFHVSRDKKSLHGAIYYPWYDIDTYYVPFFITCRKEGFWQPGIGASLTDVHLAENVILNLALEGAYQSNLITPIVQKGSLIAKQMLEKEWTHGMPLELDINEKQPDFLNKYFRPSNTAELVNLVQWLRQDGSDVVGVSELFATGKADPVDPRAPASKTRDLLRQSGANVQDYVKTFGKSVNYLGEILIKMYHQKNTNRKMNYRISDERRGLGAAAFGEISREEIGAKVALQTQAMLFDDDRKSEKENALALIEVLTRFPIVARNEEAIYFMLKKIVRSWGPGWKAEASKILPRLEDFQKKRLALAVQAVHQYMQKMMQQAKITNQEPQIDPKQLLGVIQMFMKELATFPSKDEMKARKEGEKNAGNIQ